LSDAQGADFARFTEHTNPIRRTDDALAAALNLAKMDLETPIFA
jgi:hypothetical protein